MKAESVASDSSSSASDAYAWGIVNDLALARAKALKVHQENALVRLQDAKARRELVEEGTASWWDVSAEMKDADAKFFDVLAERYDAWAEGSYAKARALKARGEEEEVDKWTKESNDIRGSAAEYRTNAASRRKEAAICRLMKLSECK